MGLHIVPVGRLPGFARAIGLAPFGAAMVMRVLLGTRSVAAQLAPHSQSGSLASFDCVGTRKFLCWAYAPCVPKAPSIGVAGGSRMPGSVRGQRWVRLMRSQDALRSNLPVLYGSKAGSRVSVSRSRVKEPGLALRVFLVLARGPWVSTEAVADLGRRGGSMLLKSNMPESLSQPSQRLISLNIFGYRFLLDARAGHPAVTA